MARTRKTQIPQAAAPNPREVIGGNNPPELIADAAGLNAKLPVDYAQSLQETSKALADANRDIPKIVENDTQMAVVTRTVVELRRLIQTIDSHRVKEKAPYLAAERAVDTFFKGMTDRLETAKTVIEKRGNIYNQQKAAAERAERERQAREATERLRQEQEEAARIAREKAEAEAAAARARNPDRKEELREAVGAIEDKLIDQSAQVQVAATIAQEAAQAASEKTAELVRTRFDGGYMATGRQVGYVEITDYDLLPLDKLRPYIPRDALEKAVKAFARQTQHKESLPGAIIEMRDATVYR